MVPLHLTYLHRLQHSFFEHVFNLYYLYMQLVLFKGLMNITPDLFLNILNPFTNDRISVYFNKHSLMSFDTKDFFVK